MAWLVERGRIVILVTGLKTKTSGFTLIELLVVLLIIGVVSSYIFLNTSILKSILVKENPLEGNFKVVTEESILRGSKIQWYASETENKFLMIDPFTEAGVEIFIKDFNLIPRTTEYKIMITKPNGQDLELDSEFSDYPLITFYPSGENSGAIVSIDDGSQIIKIFVNQNGKLTKQIQSI
jgi:general secretion pathway protein H